MPQFRWSGVSRRRLILAATVALYPACGGGDGGGLTEPTTGALQVVTNTTGSEALGSQNMQALRQAKFHPIVVKGERQKFKYYHRVTY